MKIRRHPLLSFLSIIRNFTVKKNHIGSVVSKILLYKQTDRHPVTISIYLDLLTTIYLSLSIILCIYLHKFLSIGLKSWKWKWKKTVQGVWKTLLTNSMIKRYHAHKIYFLVRKLANAIMSGVFFNRGRDALTNEQMLNRIIG